jgi:hypothetical protein
MEKDEKTHRHQYGGRQQFTRIFDHVHTLTSCGLKKHIIRNKPSDADAVQRSMTI